LFAVIPTVVAIDPIGDVSEFVAVSVLAAGEVCFVGVGGTVVEPADAVATVVVVSVSDGVPGAAAAVVVVESVVVWVVVGVVVGLVGVLGVERVVIAVKIVVGCVVVVVTAGLVGVLGVELVAVVVVSVVVWVVVGLVVELVGVLGTVMVVVLGEGKREDMAVDGTVDPADIIRLHGHLSECRRN
jgi:hypothetical protein